MSDRAKQADIGDVTLAEDVVRWSADPGLSAVFATSGGSILVLDARATRVLRTVGEASTLRDAIADVGGRVRSGIRLGDHIGSVPEKDVGPRLVRLRLDHRGIARPTACLVARAARADGDMVLLLAPTETLPALRGAARARAPATSAGELAAPPAPVASVAPSGRITWRSDAQGILTQMSGDASGLAGSLIGRSWHALGDSGVLMGRHFLAAIDARQTFRALPVMLRPSGSDRAIELELSGAPLARPTQSFEGFAGFGVVRRTRPIAEEDAASTTTPVPAPRDGPTAARIAAEGNSAEPSTVDDRRDVWASPAIADDDEGASARDQADGSRTLVGSEETPEIDRGAFVDDGPESGTQHAEPGSDDDAPPSRTTDLSNHEHAAFREIARALGARFAGDDDAASVPDANPEPGQRGAVMAFPVNPAANASAAIDAAIVSALDRLPAGVLVHRDAAILYVNQRFHELLVYPDRSALAEADVLRHLLDRLPPHADGIALDAQVLVTTGSGALLPLFVERTKVDWDGRPAELLLIRGASQADEVREQMASGLLAARDAARDRDARALLDHIEEGVAALDDSGRVLTLNESARATLASDACEVVGGSLADLFTPESEAAVAESLREARERGVSQPRETVPRSRDRSEPLRLRVARLSAANAAQFCVTLREASHLAQTEQRRLEVDRSRRADFLSHVSEEIRSPLSAIVARAEAMLSERLGSLDSERYREQLGEIHRSGERVLGVVDDLVDLARIEAGRGDLTFTTVALNEVVSGCIAEMQPQAARDRIVVRSSLSPDLRPLIADARSMRQATLNVIGNAIRATEAGGQVIVSTTIAERGEIAFRVRDTGLGMTQEEIERVLSPYGREPASGPSGVRLGLMLTKALVEANHGSLRITSRRNEGTLVEMLFSPQQALSA